MKPIVDLQGNIALPEGDVVLTTHNLVGLGDHAIYSTLPKRFKDIGGKVYIDKDIGARNDQILEAFWMRNPYIDGLTDRKANAGYVRQGLFYEVANRFDESGSIEAMERAHGLPPPYSIAPYINYAPKPFHIDLSQHVLLDFSATSSQIDNKGISEFMRAMKGKFRNAPFLQLLMPKWASLHPAEIACESVQVDGIYMYLDMLAACRGWIGSEAGGQSLAAAVRGEHLATEYDVRPEVRVCITPQTHNDRGYVFSGVGYRDTQFCQDHSSDWPFPHEMVNHAYDLRCAISLQQMRARG